MYLKIGWTQYNYATTKPGSGRVDELVSEPDMPLSLDRALGGWRAIHRPRPCSFSW